MDVEFLPLDRAAEARGVVVVVDVLRAYTTAAVAMSVGVTQLHLVDDPEKALSLRREGIVDLVLGESGGLPIEGFDLWNSPAELAREDLTGCRVAMSTSAGTRGAVAATHADRLLTGAFANAAATADALRGAESVTFVITGDSLGRDGDEDLALAEYITVLVHEQPARPEPYLDRARRSDHGRRFGRDLPIEDLAFCLRLDWYPHPLEVRRQDGGAVIRRPADARSRP